MAGAVDEGAGGGGAVVVREGEDVESGGDADDAVEGVEVGEEEVVVGAGVEEEFGEALERVRRFVGEMGAEGGGDEVVGGG